MIGLAEFEQRAAEVVLERLGLPVDAALSVLAVELLPGGGLEMARHQWAVAFTTFDQRRRGGISASCASML